MKCHSVSGFAAIVDPGSAFVPNPALAIVRDAIGHKDLDSALHAYAHLIDHDRYLNDVIRGLTQIACRFPDEPQIWQVPGDVLAHIGKTEDARRANARVKSVTNS